MSVTPPPPPVRAPKGDGATVTIAARLTVADPFEADEVASRLERAIGTAPVSYTHLTLPTILLV